MCDLAAAYRLCIFYFEFTFGCSDDTLIADLAAHRSVERGFCGNHGSLIPFSKRHNCFARVFRRDFRCEDNYLRIIFDPVVSGELGGYGRIKSVIYGKRLAAVVSGMSGVSCPLTLLLHFGFEAFLICGKTLISQDILCEVCRESVCIIQNESLLAGENCLAVFFHLIDIVVQNLDALIDCLCKCSLLALKDTVDKDFLLLKFRISVLRCLDDRVGKISHEIALDAQSSSGHRCTADQAAKYIAAAFVGRCDTVGNHECRGTDMIRDLADIYIVCRILMIFLIGDFTYFFPQFQDRIDVEHGIYILHSDGKTLQSHTCIDIFLLKSRIIALSVIFELCENIIPDLHETVAVASGFRVIFIRHILFATVIIHFRTRTAGTCAMLPEIVFLTELIDTLLRNADLVAPDSQGFIVIEINRGIETVRIKSDDVRQKFPCPVDRFPLKIIPEREVSEHLKECAVTCGMSDIVNIARTDTLLACRDPFSRRNFSSGKVRLKRRHTCIDEQDGIVVVRY